MSIDHYDLVVVGASVSGEALISKLREFGYARRVLVIDRDSRMPYERPPLSKRYLSQPELADIAVEWAPGFEVTEAEAISLDPAARQVMVRFPGEVQDRPVSYERIVIATGADPIRLPIEPEGVLRLRTVEDADRIRKAATVVNARVGIIGAGAIGVELATSLRALGSEITVLDKANWPLERLLAGYLGSEVTQWLESSGITCRWGVDIAEISGEPGRWSVRLGSGEVLHFEVLLSAVGARPSVEWLESSGLLTDDRLVCDASGRVLAQGGTREHEFGIGDVVTRKLEDGSFGRTENWTAAAEQGAQLADRLLGLEAPGPECPYFWTDIGERKVQILGTLQAGNELEIEHENPERAQALYRVGGQETDGWIGINAQGLIARRRMAQTAATH